jgi:hypothetical protein
VSPDTVLVSYATSDSTATLADSDYTETDGQLVFPPGALSDTIRVFVNGDSISEYDELFNVRLSNPVHGEIASGHAIGTILDDDPLPILSINDISVVEGNPPDTTRANFRVTLSAASERTITVDYATANGTAGADIPDSDYVPIYPPRTLTFSPGDSLGKNVEVQIIGDTTPEPDETFFLNLTVPLNAVLADSQGVCTILNDDGYIDLVEENEAPPAVTYMSLNFPNPFSDRTAIHFGLHAAGPVDIVVYSVQGRAVRCLVRGDLSAGVKQLIWDGRDDAGHPLPSGFYIVRMRADRRTFTQSIRRIH